MLHLCCSNVVNYSQQLLKAPALLVVFEEASDAMLTILAEEEAECDDADETKYQLCKSWILTGEDEYRRTYNTR